MLHLPQKCKMALSKENLLPIAPLGENLLRFFLQGDLEREAMVLWVRGHPKHRRARRKEINVFEFGILGHPDFLPLLKNADVFFFLNFGDGFSFGPYVLKVEVVQWLSPKSHETTTLQVGLPCSPFCDRQVLALAGKDWDRKISPNELTNETLIGWLILILVWGW